MLKKYILLLPVVLLAACLEESTPSLDKKSFTRIYDNNQFNASFHPIDMQQTPDGGYIILGGKDVTVKEENEDGETETINLPTSVYILKVDQFGNVERELELDDEYINPIGNLIPIEGRYYFFCMDAGTNTFLVDIDNQAITSSVIPLDLPLTKPLAGSLDITIPNAPKLLLLSYNDFDKLSTVSQITTEGSVTASQGYDIGADSPANQFMIEHNLKTGRQFPFSVGHTASGLFYFNGFYDYTFSLVFTTSLANDNITGRVNGQQQNGGFSYVLPITASTFATSIFNFGANFFLPNAAINTSSSTTSTTTLQTTAFTFPELEANARVKIIRATVKGKNVIIYGSNTKSKQIGLYLYDETTGKFMGSKYIGYSNPFEIASVIQTAQGDLVVSGTTYIAGRLPRFTLIKLSKSELKGI